MIFFVFCCILWYKIIEYVDSYLVTVNSGATMYIDYKSEALEMLDAKAERVRQNMRSSSKQMITNLWAQLDLSSIYHDWALEMSEPRTGKM